MILRPILTLSLLLATTTIGLADTPKPGYTEELQFEAILKAVSNDPSLAPAALGVFRRVAEDDAQTITEEMAAKFGMQPGQLRGPDVGYYFVRDYAFRAIGKLGTPEAVAYLEGVKASDFEGEDRRRVWPAALEALYGARLAQISTRQEKAQFLERTVRDYQNVEGVGILADWAGRQLCNSDALSSYPVVEQLLLDRDSLTGRENARFCELRMRALASDPDRVSAVAAILQVGRGIADPKLTEWAIDELTKMESPRAEEAMANFEQQVLALPDGSPQKRELMPYADAVRRRHGMVPPRANSGQ